VTGRTLARIEASMLDISNETFDGAFPFAPHSEEINGFAMHYVDEGSGEPLVIFYVERSFG
jgi:haloalkane dehalogenase